jgi:hypothetical protein
MAPVAVPQGIRHAGQQGTVHRARGDVRLTVIRGEVTRLVNRAHRGISAVWRPGKRMPGLVAREVPRLAGGLEFRPARPCLVALGGPSGYTAMRTYAKTWPQRVWAIEGSNGAGRPLAQRLLEAGEHVLDVPAKLAARVRLFDTVHSRKTDPRDAHSIAIVAVRTQDLRVLRRDGELEALRMLCDRREELTRLRVQTLNRLQRLLAELVPGQAKKDLTALQAQGNARHRAPSRDRRQDPAQDRCRGARRPDRGRGGDEEGHRRAQGPGQGKDC